MALVCVVKKSTKLKAAEEAEALQNKKITQPWGRLHKEQEPDNNPAATNKTLGQNQALHSVKGSKKVSLCWKSTNIKVKSIIKITHQISWLSLQPYTVVRKEDKGFWFQYSQHRQNR